MEAPKKTLKILTIDGGGIKGLYSAKILEQFEQKFGCISDHFDMICGTSTGGLIALGLSLKIPAAELVAFYVDKGPKIFPPWRKWFLLNIFDSLRQATFFGKFSDKNLKNSLKSVFKDHVIGDSHNLLCIPSYRVTEGKTRVFKKDYGDLDCDDATPYVDVALATSAAPTFFPMAELPTCDNNQFIDGGVWANNPTLVGYVEAVTRLLGPDSKYGYNALEILSISSLEIGAGRPVGLRRHRGFLGWKNSLFETAISGQSQFAEYFMNNIKAISPVPVHYVRIPSHVVGSAQEKHIQLDNASKKALKLILSKANQQATTFRKNPDVATFFKTKKTFVLK
ncbi:patatin [Chitinophaga oryziterrae]|uniref:Patatin n=1 Tax=Chitinophaga oryziterrae TaxID=1031224 RepID=A0A6N8JEX6_9BACT|nr:CBASS cGAMP-activated phospholipase [Chitinophaga oryziterrae]MVT42859.1 patatin [Chitinophaga oryziterrae]